MYLASSPATIGTSTFAYNTSKVNGAGVYAATSPLTLNMDVFLNNAASTSGGAVYATGALTVAGSTFNNNTATNGGAIFAQGLFTVSGSSFTANQAGSTSIASGGAIYSNSAGANSISNTNFLANRAVTTGISASGGALYTAVANLTNVLFSGNYTSSTNNSFGGAAYYTLTANSQLTGVTFTGNSTQTGSTGATNQEGGALYLGGSYAMRLYNSTISGNSAKLGGGVYNSGDGVTNFYNSVTSGNSGSTGHPDFDNANGGGYYTDGNDYVDVAATCSTFCTPLLSALGNYGGGTVGAPGYTTPVQVMLPLPGSPLLAAGSLSNVGAPGTLSGGATTDARGTGYPRTLSEAGSPHVDIGAAEANYSLSFVQQPTDTAVGVAVSPAPTVQLLESGVAGGDGVGNDQGSYAGGTLAITATPDAASAATVATTASGLESLSESFTPAATGETLTVAAQSGAATPVTVASATSNTFNVFSLTPVVSSISPTSGVAAGGTAVTITGTNFTSAATVSFGGTAATGVVFHSATSLTATSPAGTGVVDVTVTTTNGTSATSTADQFTYIAQTLSSLTVAGYASPAILTEGGTVTVTAQYANGSIDTAFTGSVTLTSSDAHALLPAAYTFTSSDAGVHTFFVTLETLGSQSITATSGSVSGSQTGILVGDAVWVLGGGKLVKLNSQGGSELSNISTTGSAIAGGVAFDNSGIVWSVGQDYSLVCRSNISGSVDSCSGGGGINGPDAIAVDGAGYIWVANAAGNTVSKFYNSGLPMSPSQGYGSSYVTGEALSAPSAIVIDKTGGVWVANKTGNSVTHIFGAAKPVVTPLSSATANGTLGTQP